MKKTIFFLTSLFVILVTPVLAFAGNNFVTTDLRTDVSAVTTGQYLDYRHYVYASLAPFNQTNDFTNAWFSVDLGAFNGTAGSGKFTQVGIMTMQGKAQWFVYSEAPITCLRGASGWSGTGCKGFYGDLSVSPGSNAWTRVEMVTYPGQNWWILRVYDTNYVAYDVARVSNSSKQIYRATAVSEEGYVSNPDPHIIMSFYHYHPEYWKSGPGFTLWPGGTGGSQTNHLHTSPSGVCPTWYGATSGIQGNPHLWRAASNDTECSVNPLF